jgi:HPt (histidine-containing phosphotransfer) domain-containing protein
MSDVLLENIRVVILLYAVVYMVEAGCDGYLAKPIDGRELPRLLAKYLSVSQRVTNETVNSAPTQTRDSEQNLAEAQTNARDDDSIEETINWDWLIDRMGDEDTIRNIMPAYTEDIQGHFDKLCQAVNMGDCKSIAFYAHALKGVGRNLSIERLADIACKMETAGRKNDIEVSTQLFNHVDIETKKVITMLSQPDWIDKAKQHKQSLATHML